jgi:hypothetical protein
MDDTVRRGAIVKAMAVFSRYQYLDVMPFLVDILYMQDALCSHY